MAYMQESVLMLEKVLKTFDMGRECEYDTAFLFFHESVRDDKSAELAPPRKRRITDVVHQRKGQEFNGVLVESDERTRKTRKPLPPAANTSKAFLQSNSPPKTQSTSPGIDLDAISKSLHKNNIPKEDQSMGVTSSLSVPEIARALSFVQDRTRGAGGGAGAYDPSLQDTDM